MSDFKNAHKALVSRILEGDDRASRAQRRCAFDNAGLGEPMRTLVSKYRADFYGSPMSRVTQDVMRRPSTWSVG